MTINTKPVAMRDVFLARIYEVMKSDPSIFFVSADFGSPVLDRIIADFPERFVNVGIAEQNLINVSTGLALEGFNVYAYAIAPFITMRCYEQIKVNLALLSELRPLNVNLIGVGAGFSYVVSGPTHHSVEDISLMRILPNFEFISPSDGVSTAAAFEFSLSCKRPKYFRLDSQPFINLYDDSFEFPECGYHVVSQGSDVALIATGYMTRHAMQVAKLLAAGGVHCQVIDLLKLKNIDECGLAQLLASCCRIVTFEEGFTRKGGLDSILLNLVNDYNLNAKVMAVGLSDEYKFALGTRQELLANYGLAPETVAMQIREGLKI